MKVGGGTGTQCTLILGDTSTFVIPRNAAQESTPPRIDHIAYTRIGKRMLYSEGGAHHADNRRTLLKLSPSKLAHPTEPVLSAESADHITLS